MPGDQRTDGPAGPRPISSDERSGVLDPQNLERYGAQWLSPAPAVRTVVDHYWQVRWHLEPGEVIEQRIIDFPAVTLTLEAGDVPAPLVVTGVQRGAWRRRIVGSGEVFGIRLRPAGLAVLGNLSPQQVADATLPLTPALDGRLHAVVSGVAEARTPGARALAADRLVAAALAERPATPRGLLANEIVDELTRRLRTRTGPDLAGRFGVGERTVQRALGATLGRGPKWVSRRIRLQEIARVLATEADVDLATLAVELGYADQSHLIDDFRTVVGMTPGAYRRSLDELAHR